MHRDHLFLKSMQTVQINLASVINVAETPPPPFYVISNKIVCINGLKLTDYSTKSERLDGKFECCVIPIR